MLRAGDGLRHRGRQVQLEVRLARRAPLPDRVQPHVGPRGGHGLPGPRHRADPRRDRHHEHLAPGQPPGALRRAGGHARPRVRGPVRVGDRARCGQPRDRHLQHPRQELHQGRVERGHPPDPPHVGGEGLHVRGRELHRPVPAQHPAQALPGQGSPAHLGGVRQPGDVHPGRRAGHRGHRLQLRAHLQPARAGSTPTRRASPTAPSRSASSRTTT